MVKNRKIEIRVSRNEYERICNNAQAKGCSTISAYLRSVALENSFIIENKIIETNSNVKKLLQLLEIEHKSY